jgi:hypothetical protein
VKSKSKTGIALGLTTIMVLALATTTIAQSARAVVSEGCANYAPIEQCLGHYIEYFHSLSKEDLF